MHFVDVVTPLPFQSTLHHPTALASSVASDQLSTPSTSSPIFHLPWGRQLDRHDSSPRAGGLHHGPWKKMAFFHGRVQFLQKSIYKVFGPLTSETECGPRGIMTLHQKLNVLIFYFFCNIYAQIGHF